jgi:hypothetical protein
MFLRCVLKNRQHNGDFLLQIQKFKKVPVTLSVKLKNLEENANKVTKQ